MKYLLIQMEADLQQALNTAEVARREAFDDLKKAKGRLEGLKAMNLKSVGGIMIRREAQDAVRLARVRVGDLDSMVVTLRNAQTNIRANLTFDEIVNEGEHAIITPVQ